MTDTDSLSHRYQSILQKIRGRAVQLVAVSKAQPLEMIESLYSLGQRDFGENYVQELIEKAEELKQRRRCGEIRWHFIGHLQTNKTKKLLPWVSCIHSVDSARLASEVAKACRSEGFAKKFPVFIQVNLEGEETKGGISPEETRELARSVANQPELELLGLMSIPRPDGSAELKKASFTRLRELEITCRPWSAGKLSMGMSDDFELAISEGATHIRVGTSIFGSRPK